MSDFDYARSDAELEAWLLFCVAVAGKSAAQTRKSLAKFFTSPSGEYKDIAPYNYVKELIESDSLTDKIKESGLGQHTRLTKAFTQIVDRFDAGWLRCCTVEDLESIHGIGPKTARFFLMSTRPNVRHAALDTHILKFLRANGYDAPKSTPTNKKKYYELEEIFLKLSDEAGKEPSDYDYEIWLSYTRSNT